VSQSFEDWELIICDDGSKDDTLVKANDWSKRDARIQVICNPANQGLAVTLDNCIAASRSELLIRQDADDISLPNRFTRLIKAMDENPEAVVIGSWVTCFSGLEDLGVIRTRPYPKKNDLLVGTIFFHPSCIMRKSAVLSVGGYGNRSWLRRSQDYYLWFRLYAAGMRGLNIQESLYHFREDQAAWRRRSFSARWMESRVRWEGFKLIGAPSWKRLLAFTPLLKCLVPSPLYAWIRRRRLTAGI
jgi:glycosyltransferase EpsE